MPRLGVLSARSRLLSDGREAAKPWARLPQLRPCGWRFCCPHFDAVQIGARDGAALADAFGYFVETGMQGHGGGWVSV